MNVLDGELYDDNFPEDDDDCCWACGSDEHDTWEHEEYDEYDDPEAGDG